MGQNLLTAFSISLAWGSLEGERVSGAQEVSGTARSVICLPCEKAKKLLQCDWCLPPALPMACPQQILQSPLWGVWLDTCGRIFPFADTREGKRELGRWENKLKATSLWSRKQNRRNEEETKPLPSLTLCWPVQNWSHYAEYHNTYYVAESLET